MKRLFLLFVAAVVSISAFAQATKPTVIVLPSDAWVQANNYMTSNGYGAVPDYNAAFKGNATLQRVATMVGDHMREGGLNVVDIDTLQKIAEDAEKRGVVFYESPYDFIINVGWDIKSDNDYKTLNLSMNAVDVFSNKIVASVVSKVTNVVLSQEDVLILALSEMPKLAEQFSVYFSDMVDRGREMSLNVMVASSSKADLEQEYDGSALMDHIESWVYDNTVDGNYYVNNISYDTISFSVMAPCRLESGAMQSPRTFAQQLSDYLSAAPFSLKTEVKHNGVLLLR